MPTMAVAHTWQQLPQSAPACNAIERSLPATGKLSTAKLGSCGEKCLTLWLRQSALPAADIPLNAH